MKGYGNIIARKARRPATGVGRPRLRAGVRISNQPALRDDPHPARATRTVSGSHVASPGNATKSTTIASISATIGSATLAM